MKSAVICLLLSVRKDVVFRICMYRSPFHLNIPLKADIGRYGIFKHRSDMDQASAVPIRWNTCIAATKAVRLDDSRAVNTNSMLLSRTGTPPLTS